MHSVGVVFRAELLRRWASWLALALLVALIGGTVLAGVSTAGRTSSAFSSFTKRYGYDAEVFAYGGLTAGYFDLPYVSKVTTDLYYANGNGIAQGHFVPNQYLGVASLPSSHLASTIKLLSGRMPTGPRDALIGFSMQQQFGLKIGSIVSVPFYKRSQGESLLKGNAHLAPRGSRVSFRVVGIEVSETDFPSSSPSYTVFTSRAFDRGIGRATYAAVIAQVRFRHGQNDMPQFQAYVNHHQSAGFVYLLNEDSNSASIAQSIQPQSTGWWFFALFAVLAGLALVGQALSRQSLVERESYPTLFALGLRPRQLFGLGMIRAGAIGAVGALGAVALAFAASPLTPVGEARAAETTQGFVFNAALFGLGALAIVGSVAALAALPSWRASQSRGGAAARDRHVRHANSTAAVLARTGAPPSVLVGVRNALDRGRGRSSVPVATALVGATVAVAALVATTVFGASLNHLVKTPPLYGQNWQLDMGNLSTTQLHKALATLDPNPNVTKVTFGFAGKYVRVGSVTVEGVFVNVAKGSMAFSLVNGRYPIGDDQMLLGATTMSQAHLHVGSRVSVSLVNKSGRVEARTLKVVGTVVLPPTFSIGGLGVGAVLPFPAALSIACKGSPSVVACSQRLQSSISGWGMAVGIAHSPAGRVALARFQRRFAQNVNVQSVPVNLVNFGQAVDFPLLLGLTLALFGAATLAHLLFVSVARRRRQVALLKVLGFVRRQVLAATCWQAFTVVVIGLVIGVPSGIAIGESVWTTFASHLGAVPLAVVPVRLVAIVGAVTVVGGVALALLPALIAVRVQPAEALREA
ncbi:MAG TPA: FtsX-like permease family protein [Acidimicrobiales bacterium]|nr:FtsX-like permease family protein [Acidimicrobiales bacterium]